MYLIFQRVGEPVFLKVIIGADSLHSPLTGVGRYTYELCKRLVYAACIHDLSGFDIGKFISVSARLEKLDREDASVCVAGVNGGLASLRASLSKSRIATRIYQQYATTISGLLLRHRSEAIFHSPNFHLPKYTRKSVVTIHDLSYLLFPKYHPAARVAWMNKLVPVAIQNSSHIICVSESTKSALVENYRVDPQKVSVTYLGVDDKFKVRDEEHVVRTMNSYGLSFGQYLLCVSTIEPRKNIEGMINAYLRLSVATRKQFPLVLVGGFGWHFDRLKSSLPRLVDDGVMHLGFVSQEELPLLYNGARCLVYPSFYEGFGLPVLEAQASGTPVIAANTSSIPEVASEAALLIDPYVEDHLLHAMVRAVEDESWLENCSLIGQQKAAEFSWDKCAEATIQVYKKVEYGPDKA